MRQPPVVQDQGVEIPEIEGRQIAGQNLLHHNVVGVAAGLSAPGPTHS